MKKVLGEDLSNHQGARHLQARDVLDFYRVGVISALISGGGAGLAAEGLFVRHRPAEAIIGGVVFLAGGAVVLASDTTMKKTTESLLGEQAKDTELQRSVTEEVIVD